MMNTTNQTAPTGDDRLKHAEYCMPRPGESELRIEKWDQPIYGPEGVHAIGTVAVVRCIECSAASYDGKPAAQPQ